MNTRIKFSIDKIGQKSIYKVDANTQGNQNSYKNRWLDAYSSKELNLEAIKHIKSSNS
jgi:hypothetical protein